MTRTETIDLIVKLLSTEFVNDQECPAASEAEAIFEQMPISHAELASGFDEATFSELARFAAHDVYRAAKLD